VGFEADQGQPFDLMGVQHLQKLGVSKRTVVGAREYMFSATGRKHGQKLREILPFCEKNRPVTFTKVF